MSEDRKSHLVPAFDPNEKIVLTGNFAEDIKKTWDPSVQRPQTEMERAIVWPDSPRPRDVKSKKPKVSLAQAEAVLQGIKDRWPMHSVAFSDSPTLYPHDHEEMPKGCWSIAWEGGPEDWVMIASQEFVTPDIFLEPMTSWCLGLYPKGDR